MHTAGIEKCACALQNREVLRMHNVPDNARVVGHVCAQLLPHRLEIIRPKRYIKALSKNCSKLDGIF
jgi:hypothetical protein